jgi:hypothetical protein
MSNDPQTVLAFAERVTTEGGWGEANVLAARYVWLISEIERVEALMSSEVRIHEQHAGISSWCAERATLYASFAKQLQRLLRGKG